MNLEVKAINPNSDQNYNFIYHTDFFIINTIYDFTIKFYKRVIEQIDGGVLLEFLKSTLIKTIYTPYELTFVGQSYN